MRIESAQGILQRAIDEHEPSHVFAMFSGGHDSLCAVHVTAQHPRFTAAVHINTGIGIEKTREFVRETCRRNGWRLLEYHPPKGSDYRSLVLRWGFPGPAGHRLMYNRLKERAIAQLVREHKEHRNDRIVLATGLRRSESARRMGYSDPVQRQGARVWVNPIFYWTESDKNEYMEHHGLQRNEVTDMLHMSGECLCGAFARPGELDEIEFFFPETAAYIRELEREVEVAGIPACRWGKRPPVVVEGQGALPFTPLCVDCGSKRKGGAA